jgi:hypothetical protein
MFDEASRVLRDDRFSREVVSSQLAIGALRIESAVIVVEVGRTAAAIVVASSVIATDLPR